MRRAMPPKRAPIASRSRTSRLCQAFIRTGPASPSLEVAAAEILLQPDIHADEEIAAPHLLYLELGDAVLAVLPGDGDDGPRVSPHDRLEGKLHREVEMRRDERPAAVDHAHPVGLERVRRVVELDVEDDA